ncbi:DUF6531 domain-containing protein [Actinomadura sp. SCN-SB]|uniref:DUF6531 domain-containing protein n=1 Tax=Actinomadura sp. SCN-SB TaxID=3373092 RepID=UPI00375245EE
MPKVAGKATRASSRQAGRQTARQGARAGGRRVPPRQGGRQAAGSGDTTPSVRGRTTGGDPIDVVTGEVVVHEVDLESPGVLPLVLDRTHVSTFRAGRWFGPGWSSALDQRLEVDDLGVCLVTTEGRVPHRAGRSRRSDRLALADRSVGHAARPGI